jgi:uncharacterized Zn finger protein
MDKHTTVEISEQWLRKIEEARIYRKAIPCPCCSSTATVHQVSGGQRLAAGDYVEDIEESMACRDCGHVW